MTTQSARIGFGVDGQGSPDFPARRWALGVEPTLALDPKHGSSQRTGELCWPGPPPGVHGPVRFMRQWEKAVALLGWQGKGLL